MTVQTDKTVRDIESYLSTYMAFTNDDQPLIVALWSLHTYTFSEGFVRQPWTTPYLYVHSPQKQSGKTLLIDLLEPIVRNPERTVDMTSSVLFRLIEAINPTLFIDEVDTLWSGAKNESLRATINGGYKHGGYVWRIENTEPTRFATFSPKLLAGIDNGHLPDTVADRCIPILLERKRADVKREIYYDFQAGPVAVALADQMREWVFENGERIADYMPKPISEISPRAFEISMPLLQIAHAAGIEKEARAALIRLLGDKRSPDSPEVAVLRTIREMFTELDTEKIHTQTIIDRLGMTAKALSGILRPFGIEGNNTMAINGKTLKGYWRYQFTETWERYL